MGVPGRQRRGAADGGAVPGGGQRARERYQRRQRAGPGEHRVTSERFGEERMMVQIKDPSFILTSKPRPV